MGRSAVRKMDNPRLDREGPAWYNDAKQFFPIGTSVVITFIKLAQVAEFCVATRKLRQAAIEQWDARQERKREAYRALRLTALLLICGCVVVCSCLVIACFNVIAAYFCEIAMWHTSVLLSPSYGCLNISF